MWKATEKGLPADKCRGIYSLVVSGDKIFAGGCHGAFEYIGDGKWKAAGAGLNTELRIVQAMTVKDKYIFAAAYGDGIFVSSDQGKTWELITEGPDDKLVTSLTVSGEKLFAGTNSKGIYVSADNGISWKNMSEGLPRAKSVKSLASNESSVYAGTDGGGVNVFASAPEGNGVYVSNDGGISWTAINKGIEKNTVQSITVGENELFAVLKNGKLFSSKDKGQTWKEEKFGTDLIVNCVFVIGPAVYAGTSKGIFVR